MGKEYRRNQERKEGYRRDKKKKFGDGEYINETIFHQGLSLCMHKLSRPDDRMS